MSRLAALRTSASLAVLVIALAGCAPAAPPSPTAAPPRAETSAPTMAPAPTAAPAKPAATSAPASKSAEKPVARSEPATPAKSSAGLAFDEQAVANFYRGKTVRIIVGYAPGGTFDLYSRLVARYLPQFLPGNPNVVVENKPGASSLLAANSVYVTEPKDGTVIASINQNLINQQALGLAGIEFDAARFQWLGSASISIGGCGVRADSGIQSIQDVIGGREVIAAADAPGSGSHDVPAILNATLGTRFKLVQGYSGASKQRLAIENKEAEAFCQADSLSATFLPMLEGPQPPARKIIILGDHTPDHPVLKGVPAAETLAQSEEARLMLKTVNAPNLIAYPWSVAPEVPQDRVAALRQALAATFEHPAFLDEARKSQVDPQYKSGEEVTRIALELLNTPPEILGKLKQILAP